MEELRPFDIATDGRTLYVVVESPLLPPDPSVVTIPLLDSYPGVARLNPTIEFDGEIYMLATRLIAGLRRSRLRRVGSVAGQSDRITHAIDVLMGGF